MSVSVLTLQPVRRCIHRFAAPPLRRHQLSAICSPSFFTVLRFASNSTPPPLPPKSQKRAPPASRQNIGSIAQKRQADASRKASLLLSRLNTVSRKASQHVPKPPSAEKIAPTPVMATAKKSLPSGADGVEQITVEIDEREAAIQQRILVNRRKILWPGLWSLFAVAGTYAAFAYLDARYNPDATSGNTQLPERTQLPQSWFLTPTVIREGLRAGWSELDKLTIGIVAASIAVHLMKRSPLPFWQHLIHITGEKRYTAFTYPFVHSNWAHIGQNMFALCWFLPGVVRYFDGDLVHMAALYVSIPLVTSYLQHFAFRWGSVNGLPLNMGSSGAIAAVFGAFCLAYPDEKVWLPSFVVVRLDAKYWAGLFVLWQIADMVKTPKGGNRPALLVHVVSLGLGAAYVCFDGKRHIWKPLVRTFSKQDLVALPK